MLPTRWTVRAMSVWTLALALAMAPAVATAGDTVFEDAVGDSTSVDISRVRVVHRAAVTVRVRSAVPLMAGQVYAFWIDTGRGRRPHFYVSFQANTEFDDSVGLVRSFGHRPSRFVRCPRMRARADMLSDKPVSLRIPRRCLADPRRVRVAVRFTDEGAGAVDWAPARRTFGPWVRR